MLFLRGVGAAFGSARQHHADPREHRWPIMLATSNNACIPACHSLA